MLKGCNCFLHNRLKTESFILLITTYQGDIIHLINIILCFGWHNHFLYSESQYSNILALWFLGNYVMASVWVPQSLGTVGYHSHAGVSCPCKGNNFGRSDDHPFCLQVQFWNVLIILQLERVLPFLKLYLNSSRLLVDWLFQFFFCCCFCCYFEVFNMYPGILFCGKLPLEVTECSSFLGLMGLILCAGDSSSLS